MGAETTGDYFQTVEEKTPDHFRANVRFTSVEYRKIKKDEAVTGKSIPWLLKTAYFRGGISAPTLDVETRKAVKRELAYIGNNLNQLARKVNSGLICHVAEDVQELLQTFRILKSFLSRDYGDRSGDGNRKNSL